MITIKIIGNVFILYISVVNRYNNKNIFTIDLIKKIFEFLNAVYT